MLTFRPLTRDDFPVLARWLAEPLVARWWSHEHSPAALERDFGPSLDEVDVTELFVVELAGWLCGLVQRYPIAAYPEYLAELSPVVDVPPGALSIDYMLGEPAARGHGSAAAAVAAVVRDAWAVHPTARDVVVPVAAGNRASWRTLERAGFTRVATVALTPDNPVDPPDHVIYRLRRPG